jgi:hypothetical protein
MKRFWQLSLGLVLLIAIYGLGWVIYEWLSAEPMRAYGRITLGMTTSEVAEAIGRPPEDSAEYPEGCNVLLLLPDYFRETGMPFDAFSITEHHMTFWMWPDYEIAVAFDQSDRAVGYYLADRQRPNLFERLRRCLG